MITTNKLIALSDNDLFNKTGQSDEFLNLFNEERQRESDEFNDFLFDIDTQICNKFGLNIINDILDSELVKSPITKIWVYSITFYSKELGENYQIEIGFSKKSVSVKQQIAVEYKAYQHEIERNNLPSDLDEHGFYNMY